MKTPRRAPEVESLEGRALLSTTAHRPVAAAAALAPRYELYTVTFRALNGSKVVGVGTLRVDTQATIGTNPATLTLAVTGLQRNATHAVTLNGFDYLQNRPAARPPASAATSDPTPAGLGPRILSDGEARPFYGTPQSSTIPSIRVGRREPVKVVRLDFQAEYDFRSPPTSQALVLHGLTVNGQYQETVPVAYGTIRPARVGKG